MSVKLKLLAGLSISILVVTLSLYVSSSTSAASEPKLTEELTPFFVLFSGDPEEVQSALLEIADGWNEGNVPMLLEVLRFTRNPEVAVHIITLLQSKTGKAFY